MGNTEKEVRTSIPHKTLTKCPPSALIHAWKQENVKQNTGGEPTIIL